MKRNRSLYCSVAALIFLLLSQAGSMACSVCYGEPGSPAARGLTWAIVVLGGVISCVLVGVVGFFVHSTRRGSASRTNPELDIHSG